MITPVSRRRLNPRKRERQKDREQCMLSISVDFLIRLSWPRYSLDFLESRRTNLTYGRQYTELKVRSRFLSDASMKMPQIRLRCFYCARSGLELWTFEKNVVAVVRCRRADLTDYFLIFITSVSPPIFMIIIVFLIQYLYINVLEIRVDLCARPSASTTLSSARQ